MADKKHRMLVVIVNYGSRQVNYLRRIIQEYSNFNKYEVKVILISTERVNGLKYKNLEIKQEIFDASLGYWLAHKHRKFIADNKDRFDIFIYSENDMLITGKNIDVFVKHSKNLAKTNLVPGFIRYETNKGKDKYLIDLHPNHAANRIPLYFAMKYIISLLPEKTALALGLHPIIRKLNIQINGKKYFEVQNLHQGSYVLTKSQLKTVLGSGEYFNERNNYAGIREGAASNAYANCGITKVVSFDDLEKSLIHHLPEKYVGKHKTYVKKQAITLEGLRKFLNKHKG